MGRRRFGDSLWVFGTVGRMSSRPRAADSRRLTEGSCASLPMQSSRKTQAGKSTAEWDINGAGDPSIEGFATDISYNIGETARFKIKTDASRYRVEFIAWAIRRPRSAASGDGSAVVSLPQRQPDCAVDWSGAVRLRYLAVSATWVIQPMRYPESILRASCGRRGGTWRADGSQQPGAKPPAIPHSYGALAPETAKTR